MEEYNELKKAYELLQRQCDELKIENMTLIAKNDELARENITLKSKYDEVSIEGMTLAAQLKKAKNTIETLEKEKNNQEKEDIELLTLDTYPIENPIINPVQTHKEVHFDFSKGSDLDKVLEKARLRTQKNKEKELPQPTSKLYDVLNSIEIFNNNEEVVSRKM